MDKLDFQANSAQMMSQTKITVKARANDPTRISNSIFNNPYPLMKN